MLRCSLRVPLALAFIFYSPDEPLLALEDFIVPLDGEDCDYIY